uniref:Uncharacterized protein n=1 Tax=Zea mays TaxID=4577 RepID=B7ZZE4_MAIZE|nr:unknown [Zea mays]ACL53731.1 unknown [Zea mays]
MSSKIFLVSSILETLFPASTIHINRVSMSFMLDTKSLARCLTQNLLPCFNSEGSFASTHHHSSLCHMLVARTGGPRAHICLSLLLPENNSSLAAPKDEHLPQLSLLELVNEHDSSLRLLLLSSYRDVGTSLSYDSLSVTTPQTPSVFSRRTSLGNGTAPSRTCRRWE